MKIKLIEIVLVSLLFLTTVYFPTIKDVTVSGQDNDIEDSDGDGIPDYLDYEEIPNNETSSNYTEKDQALDSEGFSVGNWSASYDSDETYGAWIGEVNWNNSYYINKANVPWVKIDDIEYEIPNDFTTEEIGHVNYSNYHLVYQLYSINISGVEHVLEVLWYFWNASVSGAGKINVSVLFTANDSDPHTLFVPFRIDFDIIGQNNDRHYAYGGGAWSGQNIEAFQVTTTPVDPTWGMKVKQQEDSNQNRWGGIKAWNTSEKNYLLYYHENEYKGNPINYMDGESTYMQDDLIWTTASTSGGSPIWCGPTIYLH